MKMTIYILFLLLFIPCTVNAQNWLTAGNTLSGVSPQPSQWLGSNNSFDLLVKTNQVERMRILSTGANTNAGNVGIGTSTPTFGRLELQMGPVNNTGDALAGFSVNKQTSTIPLITRRMFMVPHLYDWGYNQLSREGDFGLFWADGRSIGSQNNMAGFVIAPWGGNARVGIRITSTGNVGIGTALTSNTPQYKLAVNGTIGAKQVIIEITSDAWADYVFDDHYKLRSINEVESFIKSNKHLPSLPSSQEVARDGLDMAAMDARLLEKIEELTLYIIAQDKRIEALEQRQAKRN